MDHKTIQQYINFHDVNGIYGCRDCDRVKYIDTITFLLSIVEFGTLDHYKQWHARSFHERLHLVLDKLYYIRDRNDMFSWAIEQPFERSDSLLHFDSESLVVMLALQKGRSIVSDNLLKKLKTTIKSQIVEIGKVFDNTNMLSVIEGYLSFLPV